MAWNSNGTKLASGSVDQTARIWNIEPHGHVISLPLSYGNLCVLFDDDDDTYGEVLQFSNFW